MPAFSFSAFGVFQFTLEWGIMMAAMMLPSAAPMILLYDKIVASLGSSERALPTIVFAGVYLAIWLATALPVYVVSVFVAQLPAASEHSVNARSVVLGLLVLAAGAYQLTSLKTKCLRYCESPLSLLMRKWRSGYAATLRLAASHAAYCIGCCWALMIILVAVGAMSIPWVLAISLLVFAEKVLPQGIRTAKVSGILMIVLGVALAVQPLLASAR
jgi:predicted metal-binding membrane protein